MKSPEEIKLGLECCQTSMTTKYKVCSKCAYFDDGYECENVLREDALAYIQQLEEDKKRLQERICNQRRQLRVLHAMYEWALSVLQKAHMNDRAKLQAWLRKRGYELGTFELPESKYQQLERERDAAVEDLHGLCSVCKHNNTKVCDSCTHTASIFEVYGDADNWEWRGIENV